MWDLLSQFETRLKSESKHRPKRRKKFGKSNTKYIDKVSQE